jgi:antitoxin CptB
MSAEERAALRWKCRRGMLELDKILIKFFTDCYLQLNSEQQLLFKNLLEETDQNLWDWLVLKQQVQKTQFAVLTKMIHIHYGQHLKQ